jgi:hypothetical protein
MEASHISSSEVCGGPTNTAAADTVEKRKGQISRGRDRFISNAATSTATVTNALYGNIKIAEKSTLRD